MTPEHDRILSDAKLGVMIKGSKFLGTIIFSMKHVWNEEIPTADCDGMTVRYNPDFFMSLTKEERVGLIAHEGWHPALMHLTRLNGRDPKFWNYAGDYVINQLLVDAGMSIPQGGKQDSVYRGMSTDEVYDIIIKNPEEIDQPELEDLVYPSSGSTGQSEAELEVTLKSVLAKAKTRSELSGEDPGNIPGEARRVIEDMLNPRLPWEILLANFLTSQIKSDYTWKKPNKRFMPDFIMPSQHSEALGHVVIAIDTSGSLSIEELTEFLSEITYIHETMKPNKLTVIDCDYEIHNIHEVTDSDEIHQLEFSGNGGTSFYPVFEHLKTNPPEVLIYFTDLYADQITEDPGYPVMWICTGTHEEAPIGQTIYLK